MVFLLKLILWASRALARSRRALVLENLALRQQLATAVRSLEAGEPGGLHFELMAEGAIAMLRTRLAWISSVARTLGVTSARDSHRRVTRSPRTPAPSPNTDVPAR